MENPPSSTATPINPRTGELTPRPRRENARIPLKEFVASAWAIVQPNTRFVPGNHIDAICMLLEKITDSGNDPDADDALRNAIINIPPRHMKSLLVSVFWPCWVWTFRPESQWLFASYGESLAIRDSLRCRRLIRSAWYQSQWSHVFQLTGDQNEKRRFENDRSGHRLVTTPGGLGTGEGGDFVVCDDPHKVADAFSPLSLANTCQWWDTTMSTRGNDPKTVCKVIVMQRIALADLTGHLIDAMEEQNGEYYELLILPAEYEEHLGAKDKPWSDWRSETGELLWPSRFGKKEVDALSSALGNEAPGQMQQRPAREGGAIFDTGWWKNGKNRYHIDEDPPGDVEIVARYLIIDTALKEKQTNDYSACTLFEVWSDWRVAVRPLWMERLTLTQLCTKIEETAEEWLYYKGDDILGEIVIEDKQSGTSAIQTLQETAPEWLAARIIAFMPVGDKVYRAHQGANWCSRSCVLIPHPTPRVKLLHQMLRQVEFFPGVAHDDILDTITMGIIYLEHFIAAGYQARLEEAA